MNNELVILLISFIFILLVFVKTNSFFIFVTATFIALVTAHLFYFQQTGYYRFSNPSSTQTLFVILLNLFFCIFLYLLSIKNRISDNRNLIVPEQKSYPSLVFYFLFVLYIFVFFYILINYETILSESYNIYELERNSTSEYFGLLLMLTFFTRPVSSSKITKKFLFITSFIAFIILFLSGARLSAMQIILSYIFIFEWRKYNKFIILLVMLSLYVVFNTIGVLRLGADINFDNLLSMSTSLGILDNTFTGVIESGYIINQYEDTIANYPLINSLIYSTWPLPSSLLPDFIGFDGISDLVSRFPGGGYIANFILNTYGLLFIPIFFLFNWLIRTEGQSYGNFKYIIYCAAFITIPRFLYYNPAIMFKYIFITFLVLLLTFLIDSKLKQ